MAKKAIVMGATSGIGMEVAKLLAAKGWQVGIAGRRIERLQALISQGGITCYQQIDVTSPDAPAQLLELIDKLGGMDLYFHSSGIGWQNNSLDIEKEIKTLETNGLGFTRMVDTAFNWFAAQSSTPTNKSDFSVPESKKKANQLNAVSTILVNPKPLVSRVFNSYSISSVLFCQPMPELWKYKSMPPNFSMSSRNWAGALGEVTSICW